MGRDPHPDPGFAEAWLREQQRFWEHWAGAPGDAGYADAERVWTDACERWWAAVADLVPAPLGSQLQAALQQTRLCMSLARGAAGDAAASPRVTDPEVLFTAALDVLARGAGRAPGADAAPRYLRACEAWIGALARIAHDALGSVRARLACEPDATPRRVYEIYAEEIESRYRREAAGDAFARVVGDLLNAQVDVLAGRRADDD